MAETTTGCSKRWSAKRKMEVVLRLLRGELIDDVSREVGVEVHRLDEWRQDALLNLEEGFKIRNDHPLQGELSRAKQRIGELSMEVELLREKARKRGPLASRRWKQ